MTWPRMYFPALFGAFLRHFWWPFSKMVKNDPFLVFLRVLVGPRLKLGVQRYHFHDGSRNSAKNRPLKRSIFWRFLN